MFFSAGGNLTWQTILHVTFSHGLPNMSSIHFSQGVFSSRSHILQGQGLQWPKQQIGGSKEMRRTFNGICVGDGHEYTFIGLFSHQALTWKKCCIVPSSAQSHPSHLTWKRRGCRARNIINVINSSCRKRGLMCPQRFWQQAKYGLFHLHWKTNWNWQKLFYSENESIEVECKPMLNAIVNIFSTCLIAQIYMQHS